MPREREKIHTRVGRRSTFIWTAFLGKTAAPFLTNIALYLSTAATRAARSTNQVCLLHIVIENKTAAEQSSRTQSLPHKEGLPPRMMYIRMDTVVHFCLKKTRRYVMLTVQTM